MIRTVRRSGSSQRRSARILVLAVLFCPSIGLTIGSPTAIAQSSRLRQLRPQQILVEASKQLTFIRPDNQYVDRQTQKIRTDYTALARLIEYHVYSRGRSPLYRLDWKLTLADYLGAFELMDDDNYPGASQLRSNPAAADRAQVRSWSPSQREQFVNTLTALYNPASLKPTPPLVLNPTPVAPRPEPAPTKEPLNRPIPQTGDADRLKPRR